MTSRFVCIERGTCAVGGYSVSEGHGDPSPWSIRGGGVCVSEVLLSTFGQKCLGVGVLQAVAPLDVLSVDKIMLLLEHLCICPSASITFRKPTPPPAGCLHFLHSVRTDTLFKCFFQARLRAHTLEILSQIFHALFPDPTVTAGRGVRVMLGRQSFQEIVLLVGIFQRSYS